MGAASVCWRGVCIVAALLATSPVAAQVAATLGVVEGYGNLETAGAVATIGGDTDRDSTIALEYRRVGDPSFKSAQGLLRIDATHLAGSVFSLLPATNYEFRFTLADPDGVSGASVATATFATRADTLPEPSLRTLYVATTGSNANNGLTPGTAVQTIQRGADLALAGDVVLIAPGVYREEVTLPRSGTAAQPIVFRGQADGVVLDGSETIAAGSAWEAISGVHRRAIASATGHVVSDQGRLFRYDSLAALQTLAAGAPGGFWYDGTYLYVKFTTGAPTTHTVHAARFESGITIDSRAFIRIENIEIRHYGAGDYGKGIYLRYSNDCVVRTSRIHDIGSAGVWIKGGARHRIEDNTFTDTSIPNWPWDETKGSSAENNAVVMTDDLGRGHVVRRNAIEGWFNGIGPCGGSAPPGSVTMEVDVYRNTFKHHNDDALEPEGYCANIRMFENTISDSHMAFAVAPAAPGPTFIVRNVAWNTGNTRTSQIDGYTSSALKINSGYPEPIGPLLLFHNTFVTTAPATEAMYLLNPGFSTFIRARNNIFSGTRYVMEKVNPVVLDWNYDLLYSTDPTRFVRWMGTTYANLAALQGGQNQELNGWVAPPGLVAPASGNFGLSPTSAAIDRGVVLANINDGFAGSAPDMGAIEYADRIFANGFQ